MSSVNHDPFDRSNGNGSRSAEEDWLDENSTIAENQCERERVVNIAQELDFSSTRFGGKPYEKILLAICSLVSDEELSRRFEEGTIQATATQQRLILSERFRDLMEVNSLGSKEHSRIRQLLRDKTELF